MQILYAYLSLTFFVWIRRAILMCGSIKRYSLLPIRSWQTSSDAPRVSLIVPCRNEAHNLGTLLPSLAKQDYPNLEMIFIDDRSEDDTLRLLEKFRLEDPRIRILKGKPLPEGWTGKNHAMHQCAQAATGDYLLFTDADTEHLEFSVSSSVRYAQERGLDLLTLSARCVCKSFGEHLIQPMGIGCFSVWFRLDEVNDPNSSTPLCCGQYLMIKKKVYESVGGSQAVRSEVTEDLALFRNVKKAGYRCELAIGAHIFATRMYRSFKEAWGGWRRIYLHALGKNVPSLIQKILMLIFYSFGPFLVLGLSASGCLRGLSEYNGVFLLSAALCGFILFMRSRSHVALKAAQWSIALHPLSALVITGIILDCLRHHFQGRKVEWKKQRY